MTAIKVIVTALNENGEKSEPIRIYQTSDSKKIPKQFVLKLEDAGTNDDGHEQIRLKNGEFGLIVTNSKNYINDKLTGFRRKLGEDVFLLCELHKEEILTVKSVAKPDEFF